MKKGITFLTILLCGTSLLFGQGKYSTKTGEINFEASVPSFEEVKARNSNVSAVLVSESGDFAALALMKGFRFKVALMEEHFNENYIESTTYPKATFKGKISNFIFSDLNEGEKEFVIKGTINMHGVDKKVEIPAIIKMQQGLVSIRAQFKLTPSDFNIEIPSIVSNKIAEEVMVSIDFTLSNN